MSQASALIRSGLFRRRGVAIQALEALRRRGGPVPPGIRRAYGMWRQTSRVPAQLPRLRKLPRVLRLPDSRAPGGVMTIQPTPGQSAVLKTDAGTFLLTPDKIMRAYKEERRKLPQYRRLLADNRRRVVRTRAKLERIKRVFSGSRPGAYQNFLATGLRGSLRNLESDLREREQVSVELTQAMQEAEGQLAKREEKSADLGLGFIVSVPLAIIVAALSMGAYGIKREIENTSRLETQVDALDRGIDPSKIGQAGFFDKFGTFFSGGTSMVALLVVGVGAFFLLRK